MNETSSRSHCIASLSMNRILTDQSGKKYIAKSWLRFVDLSGGERTSKTEVEGMAIKQTALGMEGICINMDLTAIGYTIDNCAKKKAAAKTATRKTEISAPSPTPSASNASSSAKAESASTQAKAKGQNRRATSGDAFKPSNFNTRGAAKDLAAAMPSALVNALWEAFKGETLVTAIVCVSPAAYNGMETGFSVEFGERISRLPTEPTPVHAKSAEGELKLMRHEMEENKAALSRINEGNKMYARRFGKDVSLSREVA